MRARRVLTLTVLRHNVQIGFQIRGTGPADWPWGTKLHWQVAGFVDDHAPVTQCWADLVSWALGPDTVGMSLVQRAAAMLPWRPINDRCREDARHCGACYCGGVITSDFAAERPEHAAQRGIVIVPAQKTAP